MNYLQAEIVIIVPMPYQSTHFLIYFWEFTDGFVQRKPNINDYFWIRSSEEVRNDTESAWIIVKGSRSRKLDFPNICILFHHFSKYIPVYNDYFALHDKKKQRSVLAMLLIHFFCYFGKQSQFLLPGAYVFLTSSVHIPLNTVFNQIW